MLWRIWKMNQNSSNKNKHSSSNNNNNKHNSSHSSSNNSSNKRWQKTTQLTQRSRMSLRRQRHLLQLTHRRTRQNLSQTAPRRGWRTQPLNTGSIPWGREKQPKVTVWDRPVHQQKFPAHVWLYTCSSADDRIFISYVCCDVNFKHLSGSVQGLESLEKPWIWLDQIQGLEILEFYKVVLKSLEFNCDQ